MKYKRNVWQGVKWGSVKDFPIWTRITSRITGKKSGGKHGIPHGRSLA